MNNGLNFGEIGDTLGRASTGAEARLREIMRSLSDKEDVSLQDMLFFQQAMEEYSIMSQAQSTVVKKLGDNVEFIIKNAA